MELLQKDFVNQWLTTSPLEEERCIWTVLLGKINLNEDSTVQSFTIASLDDKDKKDLTADAYVSAMPVDLFKLIIPEQWKGIESFSKLDGLNGVPVINIHLWFDKINRYWSFVI